MRQEEPYVHLTFLDAFTLFDFDEKSYCSFSHYPSSKHSAEHYVDIDLVSTDTCLANAFNINI